MRSNSVFMLSMRKIAENGSSPNGEHTEQHLGLPTCFFPKEAVALIFGRGCLYTVIRVIQ